MCITHTTLNFANEQKISKQSFKFNQTQLIGNVRVQAVPVVPGIFWYRVTCSMYHYICLLVTLYILCHLTESCNEHEILLDCSYRIKMPLVLIATIEIKLNKIKCWLVANRII